MASQSRKASRVLDAFNLSQMSSPPPPKPEEPEVLDNAALLSQARTQQILERVANGGVAYPGEEYDEDDYGYEGRSSFRLPGSSGSGAPIAGAGGFRLRYDDETELREIDIGGADQAQKMAEFVTNSINNLSHGLTVQKAMEELGLRDKDDLIPGMETRLLPHQAIGVAWMVNQEKKSPHQGGILADDMGLGKTVQMIATMACNLPSPDSDCRVTLIVVPAALLHQWKEEIEDKSNGVFNVHVHYGKDKLKRSSDLKQKDVVITTYQTLCQDFLIPGGVEADEEEKWVRKNGGLLAKTNFFRVVADEAQFIRNRSTRASRTLAWVRARYRWMLTGTPVTNTLADIYGLVRFGRFRPWNDWNDFNVHVARMQLKDAPLAGQRAREILKPLMMRRTKNSTLEGNPILQLKAKDIELVVTEFSKDERDLYDHFEKKTRLKINRFIKANTLAKNHAYVLVLIQRLRQLCAHPYLVLADTDEDNFTASIDGVGGTELLRATKKMGPKWILKVKDNMKKRSSENWMDDDGGDDEETTSCPKCEDLFLPDTGRVLSCAHEICVDCLNDLANGAMDHNGVFGEGDEGQNDVQEKKWERALEKGHRPCPTCKEMVSLNQNDVFKSVAFRTAPEDKPKSSKRGKGKGKGKKRFEGSSLVRDESDDDDDSDDDDLEPQRPAKKRVSLEKMKKKAPPPKKEIGLVELLDSDDDDLPPLGIGIAAPASPVKTKKRVDSDDSDSDGDTPMMSRSALKRKLAASSSILGKRKASGSRKPENTKELLDIWAKGDSDLEPSAKMIEMVRFIEEWDESMDKIIVFSQWTSNLDLVQQLLDRHGIRHLRYDGSMDRLSREKVLAIFKKSGGPRVMMTSTKCGGVGLNLVSANRIINMDLSWNYASESQAYDRCHRLGQNKDVFIKRLVVKDTIEERMLKLQEVKSGLADAALGEGTGGVGLNKLSVKDIRLLFGMNKDENQASMDT